MTDRTQPEAVADCIFRLRGLRHVDRHEVAHAMESMVARIADLEAQLEAIGAGGVSGPLIGQPQAVPDLSQLTERGAVAWAGVDAQGLRDGGASPSANAGEPSGHIKEPYTLAEIKAKIASNDYSAEMLLQHAMLLLDSASLAASAGEPVAWRYRPSAVWDYYVLTDDPGKAARARANGLHVEALCLTTPQPTQAQAEPKSGAKSFQTYGEANAYSKGYYAGKKAATQAQAGAVPQCWCLTCRPMRLEDPYSMRMALCPTCGNKRCPKANDHRNECTGSNEPGQPGSAYSGGIKGGQHGAE